MTSNLRRFTSFIMSFIMLVSCLLVVNITSVSAYTPEVLYKHYGYASDADVVDSLGEDAKTMNPILLKKKFSSANFGEETTATDEVYKNFYDVDKYDKDLDSELGYTGATSLEESGDKSYFAYVVALGQGKRYYVYPYTLYSGENQNVFDGTSENKIEIVNN